MRLRTAHLAFAAAGILILFPLGLRVKAALADAKPRVAATAAAAGPVRLRYGADAPQLTMLKVEAIDREPLPASEPLSARIAYDEDHTARLFPAVAGRVLSAAVQPGDKVRVGQDLATLDSPDYSSARADLEKAQADEVRKQRARDRARELITDESVAVRDLEAAEADFLASRAETERARRRLQNIDPRNHAASRTLHVSSPIAGTITERNASPALEVQPGQALPLFVVSDLTRLWAYVEVPDRYLSSIGPGQRVILESEAVPGQRRGAHITHVVRVMDPNTRRLGVRAELTNLDGALLPEMFVRARLLSEDGAQAVRVSSAALVTHGVSTFVYVEATPHEFERRAVHVARRDGADSYVDRGLAPGERVVTTGALLLDAEYPESGSGS